MCLVTFKLLVNIQSFLVSFVHYHLLFGIISKLNTNRYATDLFFGLFLHFEEWGHIDPKVLLK